MGLCWCQSLNLLLQWLSRVVLDPILVGDEQSRLQKPIHSLYQFCEKVYPTPDLTFYAKISKICTVPNTKILNIDTVPYTNIWKIDTLLDGTSPYPKYIGSAPPGNDFGTNCGTNVKFGFLGKVQCLLRGYFDKFVADCCMDFEICFQEQFDIPKKIICEFEL